MPLANAAHEFEELTLLVSFCDINSFYDYCQGLSALEIATFLAEFYELIGEVIGEAGGRVIKFIGDAALIIFAAEDAGRGVAALRRLQAQSDAWLAARGTPCRNIIAAHIGPVCYGPAGTREHKQPDVFGNTVNLAAKLPSPGLAITPQLFAMLDEEAQRLFRPASPPARYIAVDSP